MALAATTDPTEITPLTVGPVIQIDEEWEEYQAEVERAKRLNKNCLCCGICCLLLPCTLLRIFNLILRYIIYCFRCVCCPPPDFSIPPEGDTLRVAWTSCNHQRRPSLPQSFRAMSNSSPDILILAGDNIYIDLEVNAGLAKISERLAYRCMGSGVMYNEHIQPEWTYPAEYNQLYTTQRIAQIVETDFQNTVVLATWDDHDFRGNYTHRTETRQFVKTEFLKFFEKVDPRGVVRAQIGPELEAMHTDPDRGIYYSYDFDKGSVRARIYMLDNRYYLPTNKKQANDILGAQQWNWFSEKVAEAQANEVTHHIVVNGTNVFTLKMCGVFPEETWTDLGRQNLLDILAKHGIEEATTLLSGDIHMGVVNRKGKVYEFVAPSLTHSVLGCFAQCVGFFGCLCGVTGNICGCYGRNGPGCFCSRISNDNGYAVIDINGNTNERVWAIVNENPSYADADCTLPCGCCGC